jgi:hypothetical protein
MIDVLLTLALIKQAKFLICDSSGKFQNDLDLCALEMKICA